jgi:hypothetical protein
VGRKVPRRKPLLARARRRLLDLYRPDEDPQQQAVYAWEGLWTDFNRKTLSIPECRWTVHQACFSYGVETPTIFPGAIKARWAYYHSEKHHISLNRSAQNIPIVLHEAAHAIVSKLAPRAQDHGPTWLGVYLDLLIGFLPASAIYPSARTNKLRWDNRLVKRRKVRRKKEGRPKAAA